MFFMVALGLPVGALAASTLSLYQAERLALRQAPVLTQLQANSDALNQSAIADGSWDDPRLMAGVANLPTNTFSITQENMTQIQVGLSQQFPRGRSLSIHSLQDRLRAASTLNEKQLMKLKILKAIRVDWLNAYYWQQAAYVYKKERKIFKHLLSVNAKLLANNQLQQKDVVRAQFELSQITQLLYYAEQQHDTAKSQLARWLPHQVNKLQIQLPHWPTPPSLQMMKTLIRQQPLLLADQKNNAANEQGIKLAQQKYIPGVNLGVVYGIRKGENLGKRRSDFIGAQVSMDLPFFTKNRQARRVKASQEDYVSSQMQELSDYRYLQSQLLQNYSAWKKLLQQHQIYQTRLVKEAKYYTESTQISYQNKQTDFPTLARAYVSFYNTQLAALKTHIGLLQARANLLFLQGK